MVVKTTTDVCHSMGKQVIVEWVQTPEVLKLWQDMGAQFGRGICFNVRACLMAAGITVLRRPAPTRLRPDATRLVAHPVEPGHAGDYLDVGNTAVANAAFYLFHRHRHNFEKLSVVEGAPNVREVARKV